MPDMTSCEEALRMLAGYLDGELEPDAAQTVSRHIETCRSCYSRAEFERGLKMQLAELSSCEMGPDFEARIRTIIGKFAGAGE